MPFAATRLSRKKPTRARTRSALSASGKTSQADPDRPSAANHVVSVNQAKSNFEDIGACDPKMKSNCKDPEPGLNRDPKWVPKVVVKK